jgi:putative heme-binding domain-containing protein
MIYPLQLVFVVTFGLLTMSSTASTATNVFYTFEHLEAGDAKIRSGNSKKLDALVNALLETHPSELAKISNRLSILATQGRHPETRTAAFAAWMSGTRSANGAYWLARYSPSVLIDFVRALPLLANETVRNANYDFIFGLAQSGVTDAGRPALNETGQQELRRASAQALASMTVKNVGRVALLNELMAKGTITEADTIAPIYAALAPPKPRKIVDYWTFDMLKGDVSAAKANRNFSSGQEMFRVGSCLQCHVISGEGKTLGPDLTDIRTQYDALGLLEHIIDPSLKIDDEYKSVIIEMNDKKEHFGTVLSQDDETLSIAENPLKPESAITIQKSDIKLIDLIEMSPMPSDLLITLEKKEIWDLIAYLLSANDPAHEAFSK